MEQLLINTPVGGTKVSISSVEEECSMFRGIDKASNELQAYSSRAVGKYNYITQKIEWEFFDL